MTKDEASEQLTDIQLQIAALGARRSAILAAYAKEHAPFKYGDHVTWKHGGQTRRGVIDEVTMDTGFSFSYYVRAIRADGSFGAVERFRSFHMRGLAKE